MPQHLLHTKLLLFDHDDGTAEIWVGSHNWTQRALLGPNIEASIVMHVEQSAPIYGRVVRLLDFIQHQCEPYRPELLEEYKKLQRNQADGGGEPIMPVIQLAGEDSDQLTGAITIFGTQTPDLDTLRTLKQPVLIDLHDTISDAKVTRYEGIILHVGLQPAANPDAGGLAFSQRRFALADGKQFCPILVKPRQPDRELLQHAAYFVTVQIKRRVDEVISLDDTPMMSMSERWIPVSHDPLIARVRPEDRTRLTRRPLTMKIPSFLQSEHRPQEQLALFSEIREPQNKPFPLVVWRRVSGIRREPED